MNEEKGYVIVVSLIMVGVLVIFVTALSSFISGEISFLGREEGDFKAFYVAEAGLEYGATIIDDNSKWNSAADPALLKSSELDRLNAAISTGELSELTKNEDGNMVTLVGTAGSRGREKKITGKYSLKSGSFSYSIVSNGGITMFNNATITGNEEGGDLYCKDHEISYKNNFELVDSELHDYQSLDIIPVIDFTELKDKATVYTEYEANNNLDLSTIGDQITYVEGDLTIANNTSINGNGILIIDGKLTINNSLDINTGTEDDFIIFIRGEGVADDENALVVESGNTTEIKGMIFSTGNIYFKNSPVIKGSLIAKGAVEFKNDLDFYYSTSYLDTFTYWNIELPVGDPGTNEVNQLVYWQES